MTDQVFKPVPAGEAAAPVEDSTAYGRLLREARELALLGSAMGVLGWDEQTYMPPGATSLRAQQVSLLARMAHERHTGSRYAELLVQAEEEHRSGTDADAAVNLKHWRRDFDRAAKLPAEFVEELSSTAVMSEHAWTQARRDNDFSAFEPYLGKIIELKQREVDYVGGGEAVAYDTLLDEYEPGMTAGRLREIFSELRRELVDLTSAVRESGRRAPRHLAERTFPIAGQEAVAKRSASAFGFDFSEGRLDVSAHPFCAFIGPGDTRMTTRYDEKDISNSFFSVLHETGHGLYDQGVPARHFGTPLGEFVSLGIHESQSRLWENLVGRSEAFWQWMWPLFQKEFSDVLKGVELGEWMFAINNVEPSLIRTESDEVTYNLHIILRFELEQALLSGELKPKDLPGEWNSAMAAMLGVTPDSDANGCLQDIHWSGGGIGYFPTYTLGNLIGAQLFEAAQAQLGDLQADFAKGDFARLLAWLRENVHSHGKRYSAEELVERSTGKPLSAEPLLQHLREKVRRYYGG